MDFKFSLEKRKNYLSMNKNMQNSYLVGCMKSTVADYDYHIGSLFLYRKYFEMFHSIGNFRLSRIQTILEKDPTFYSKVHHSREIEPLTNAAISCIQDLFSKHGECMQNKGTMYIPDNFSR